MEEIMEAISKKGKPENKEKLEWERGFLYMLMIKFMIILETVSEEG